MSTAKKPAPSVVKSAAQPQKVAAAHAEVTRQIASEADHAKAFLSSGVENLQQSHEEMARVAQQTAAFNKEGVEALMESGKVAAELSKELQEALVAEAKDIFNENVQLSKELLACRNFGDFAEVQSRAAQSNLTRFFENSSRFSEAWFKLATSTVEPLTQQANQVSEQIKKNIAA